MPLAVPAIEDVARFLGERFEGAGAVELLKGGAWSSAFGFQASGRERVARFGQHREDYEKDRIAGAWAAVGLPIPSVTETGEAFGGAYAISERHRGEPLEGVAAARIPAVLTSLFDALEAIREIDVPGDGFGMWLAPDCDAPHASWPEYLLSTAERDDERLRGWRERLAGHERAQDAFLRGNRELRRRVAVCPDERKLVHNDLPNNVLVGDDDRLTAVFDWGNALVGDPLYDVAWLCFESLWLPGLRREDVIALARERFDEPGLEARIACYELHLALDSLQYQAFAGHRQAIEVTLRWTDELLRG